MINDWEAELPEHWVEPGRVEEQLVVQRLRRAPSHHRIARHQALSDLECRDGCSGVGSEYAVYSCRTDRQPDIQQPRVQPHDLEAIPSVEDPVGAVQTTLQEWVTGQSSGPQRHWLSPLGSFDPAGYSSTGTSSTSSSRLPTKR